MVPEQRVKSCNYQVCHMVAEKCVKQVPYTVCKPVHYTKTINVTSLCAEAGCLHGHPLRAAGGLQASAGARSAARFLAAASAIPAAVNSITRACREPLRFRGGPGLATSGDPIPPGVGSPFLLRGPNQRTSRYPDGSAAQLAVDRILRAIWGLDGDDLKFRAGQVQ